MVDWPTYEGFRRYHSECHACHGPEGEGSSYAPALKKSVMNMDYYDFLEIVSSARKNPKGNRVHHACIRHQPEHDVLPGRYPCIFAGTGGGEAAKGPSEEEGTEIR